MLKISIQKNDFLVNGSVLSVNEKNDFVFSSFDELPDLLFEKFYKEITAFLDCTQIYFFARAQFIPDTYSYVTHTNDLPELFSSEIYGFFERICRFLEGRKRQVVQTIWQAYNGDSNVVMNFYYKAD
jgi:hypothetical protein